MKRKCSAEYRDECVLSSQLYSGPSPSAYRLPCRRPTSAMPDRPHSRRGPEDPDPLPQLLPHIAQAVGNVSAWALNNMRARDPAFKVPYSTSKLNGVARIEEHLEHDNAAKMIDVYGVCQSAFIRLIDELGLQDSKHVTKEEKLAMFLRTVKNSASLRSIQDGTQRARSTESDYIKEVLSLLIEKGGFYDRYVKLPNSRSEVRPKLQHDKYKEFRGCIGAIDGTHLPIRYVRLPQLSIKGILHGDLSHCLIADACVPVTMMPWISPGKRFVIASNSSHSTL